MPVVQSGCIGVSLSGPLASGGIVTVSLGMVVGGAIASGTVGAMHIASGGMPHFYYDNTQDIPLWAREALLEAGWQTIYFRGTTITLYSPQGATVQYGGLDTDVEETCKMLLQDLGLAQGKPLEYGHAGGRRIAIEDEDGEFSILSSR